MNQIFGGFIVKLVQQLSTSLRQEVLLEQQLFQQLSLEQQQAWLHWRKRLTIDPQRSMLPRSLFGPGKPKLTHAQVRKNNTDYSRWLSGYSEWEVVDLLREHRLNLYSEPQLTVETPLICAHLGVGLALGLDYMKTAISSGFLPFVGDWQSAAIYRAEKKMDEFLAETPYRWEDVRVLQEAKEFCKNLPHWRVRKLQIARVVEHTRREDAEEILFYAGGILKYPENRIVLVGALEGDHNSRVETTTSHHYSESFLLTHLSHGAGRLVKVYRWDRYRDLANEFTALTVRADW